MNLNDYIKQRRELKHATGLAVHADLAEHGCYIAACDNGRVVTVTPSTRSDKYQITNFWRGEPTNHIDAGFTDLGEEVLSFCGTGFERQDPTTFDLEAAA